MQSKNVFQRFAKKQNSFTLIELLVVIAVIGLLVSVVVVFIGPQKEKARDANRMTSMRNIQKMLEMYVINEGVYPASTEDYQILGHNWGTFWQGYGTIPQDPLAGQNYAYVSDGSAWEIFAKFEREPVNPSFSCGGLCGPNEEYNAKLDSLTGGTPVTADCSAHPCSQPSGADCVPLPAGEYGLPACQKCDGISLDPVNITAFYDSQGSNTCDGTCAQYCSSGTCISANTPDGTCFISTNIRVVSGGDGKCSSGTCVTEWVCGNALVDPRDDKSYATVQIGAQCWMKQGLNVGTRVDGANSQGTSCSSINKYCYANTDVNCDSNINPNYPDGALYQWNQANCSSTVEGGQGICLDGWHVPTDTEFSNLVSYLGSNPGTKLKPGGSSGFEGNLAGRLSSGNFVERGSYGRFWSSTQSSVAESWYWFVSSGSSQVTRTDMDKNFGLTIRCIKNIANVPPDITTNPASPISSNTAILNGDITYTGGLNVTVRGFQYGLSETPTWTVSQSGNFGVDDYYLPVTGLSPSTTYYFRAFATNDTGTGYGSWLSFTTEGQWYCGNTLLDIRDAKTYATVQIGAQCWMKQGLNVGIRVDGTSGQGTSCSSIKKYCYNNDSDNCNLNPNPYYPDGGLYLWYQTMCGSTVEGSQGICPDGWHVPTDFEMCLLEQIVDPTITCDTTSYRGVDGGTKLKAGGSSGFEGNFGGYRRSSDGGFSARTTIGYFWSSSQSSADYAWSRMLAHDEAGVNRWSHSKALGATVRCIKN